MIAALCAASGCGSSKTVLNVIGQPPAAASKMLAADGLRTSEKKVFSMVPAGLVAATDPPVGKEVSGSSVVLKISSGPPAGVVPNTDSVEGANAAAAMRAAGLHVDTTNVTSTLVPAGFVIRSSPPSGTKVGKGGSVVLLVSGGARTTVIPDLSGQPIARALDSLNQARLVPLLLPAPGIGSPGKIGAQSPPPGSVAAVGTTVRVWTDRQPGPAVVPSLAGLSGGSANVRLQGLGLEPRFVSRRAASEAQLGQVLGQSPSPGATLSQGSSVTVVIGVLGSKGKDQTPTIGSSFGLRPSRRDTYTFVYEAKKCPSGRGFAAIVPLYGVPYRSGSAKITFQGPVDLGDGRIAQIAVTQTTGDYLPGSADVEIKISPCPA
jgi:beta-lactam-binding protein with PASTA domain